MQFFCINSGVPFASIEHTIVDMKSTLLHQLFKQQSKQDVEFPNWLKEMQNQEAFKKIGRKVLTGIFLQFFTANQAKFKKELLNVDYDHLSWDHTFRFR
jgi:hypothetical protein